MNIKSELLGGPWYILAGFVLLGFSLFFNSLLGASNRNTSGKDFQSALIDANALTSDMNSLLAAFDTDKNQLDNKETTHNLETIDANAFPSDMNSLPGVSNMDVNNLHKKEITDNFASLNKLRTQRNFTFWLGIEILLVGLAVFIVDIKQLRT